MKKIALSLIMICGGILAVNAQTQTPEKAQHSGNRNASNEKTSTTRSNNAHVVKEEPKASKPVPRQATTPTQAQDNSSRGSRKK